MIERRRQQPAHPGPQPIEPLAHRSEPRLLLAFRRRTAHALGPPGRTRGVDHAVHWRRRQAHDGLGRRKRRVPGPRRFRSSGDPTYELQSLMRISYSVFYLTTKITI